ncbi:hypothetical protein LJU02_05450 [Corynebacterium pseudotuberculosis]|uniref:hypothetical protein n=1 Tax=Corynebacterium pseudotuberculosis TaxID=1719 RepID=UPI0002605F02|nr:hypothetical protein [Corynebacterium pseudotuberculosis]AKS13404.1 Hypothetical protein CpE19_1066 [Corynebacterium pseudotuberculosis]ATB62011.1 Hypothetical protein BFF96_1129 [Corynebacterium pseudotuberculosis]AUY60516.1 Hypothetical protein BFG00_1129 [Corynebacterium pseudotuberculosis]UTO25479.1 hypothetical protein NMK91_05455 [Corynebacterium pseudotuberculosis]WAE79891.1 hypothetical protein LJU20_05455 [Corynebacterium pseudotuberculosis]
MTSIELTDVDFSYNSRPLLNHISLRVGAGEHACLSRDQWLWKIHVGELDCCWSPTNYGS